MVWAQVDPRHKQQTIIRVELGKLGVAPVENLISVLSQRLNLHTGDTVKQTPELPVPRQRPWNPVVAVEQLPPQELISGDGQPLSAGQTRSQHSIMGQTQEDLQNQAVRQNWTTLHLNILKNMPQKQPFLCYNYDFMKVHNYFV
uniref:Uncharacterized protein n=1 Tax=Nothobranchius furzeri TaxID=105023 RepID=A0A8C6VUL9_NOTFU